MDLGYVVVGAAGGVDFVGDFGVGGVGEIGGLGCLRVVVGIGFNDESGLGSIAAVFVGVGGVSRARGTCGAVETGGAGGWRGDFVLYAVDCSQLRCFSSIHSGAG